MSVQLLEARADLFPIRTRVRRNASGEHGTILSWALFGGLPIYVVLLDGGARIVSHVDEIERATPRPGWRPVVVAS